MASKKEKIQDGLRLNNLIRRLGMEKFTALDDGTVITRFERLARLIWDNALGYTQKDPKTGKETIHFPSKAFMTMIYERMEGRIPMALPIKDDGGKASIAKKVSEQTKSRLNDSAERYNKT